MVLNNKYVLIFVQKEKKYLFGQITQKIIRYFILYLIIQFFFSNSKNNFTYLFVYNLFVVEKNTYTKIKTIVAIYMSLQTANLSQL